MGTGANRAGEVQDDQQQDHKDPDVIPTMDTQRGAPPADPSSGSTSVSSSVSG
jgi:hypothetical protein